MKSIFRNNINIMKNLIILNIILISYCTSDTSQYDSLSNEFNLIQLRKGINNKTPSFGKRAYVNLRVYDENDKELSDVDLYYTIGLDRTPLCVEFVIINMNEGEKVMFKCPSKLGFKSLAVLDANIKEEDAKKDLTLEIEMLNPLVI